MGTCAISGKSESETLFSGYRPRFDDTAAVPSDVGETLGVPFYESYRKTTLHQN